MRNNCTHFIILHLKWKEGWWSRPRLSVQSPGVILGFLAIHELFTYISTWKIPLKEHFYMHVPVSGQKNSVFWAYSDGAGRPVISNRQFQGLCSLGVQFMNQLLKQCEISSTISAEFCCLKIIINMQSCRSMFFSFVKQMASSCLLKPRNPIEMCVLFTWWDWGFLLLKNNTLQY